MKWQQLWQTSFKEKRRAKLLSAVCRASSRLSPFGMAALLPHKKLTAELRNDVLTVLADGQPTASGYRDKILKSKILRVWR